LTRENTGKEKGNSVSRLRGSCLGSFKRPGQSDGDNYKGDNDDGPYGNVVVIVLLGKAPLICSALFAAHSFFFLLCGF
jgi:hypothetical protein